MPLLAEEIRCSGHVRRERRGGARLNSVLPTVAAETATKPTDPTHW